MRVYNHLSSKTCTGKGRQRDPRFASCDLSLYRCVTCSIVLVQAESRFLHVHHRNGQKHDNADTNLKVLCIACHAEEPMHGPLTGADIVACLLPAPEARRFLAYRPRWPGAFTLMQRRRAGLNGKRHKVQQAAAQLLGRRGHGFIDIGVRRYWSA